MESHDFEELKFQQFGGLKFASSLTHFAYSSCLPVLAASQLLSIAAKSNMASNKDISKAMARPAGLSIDKLPKEIICHIIESTIDIDDHDSLKHLAVLVTSSPKLYEIFRAYRQLIMLHLLQNKARGLAWCFAKAPEGLNEVQTQNRWWFLMRLTFHIQRFIYRRHDDYVLANKRFRRRRAPTYGFFLASRHFLRDFLALEIFNTFGRNASGQRGVRTELWESLPISSYLNVLMHIRRRIYYCRDTLKLDLQLQRRLRRGLLPDYKYRCFIVTRAFRSAYSRVENLYSAQNNSENIEDFVCDTGRWERSGPSLDSNAWTLVFLGWGHA